MIYTISHMYPLECDVHLMSLDGMLHALHLPLDFI